MSILGIPNEVLLLIAEYLSTRDLFSIFLTCRRHNSLLQPCFSQLALQWAAKHGKESLAVQAIWSGADVNKFCGSRVSPTPLHTAARQNHPNIICMLVARGATIDSRAYNSQTPLYMAASLGHTAAVRVLLELGADMMCTDKYGDPPAFCAWNPDCMKAFIDAGFDLTTKGGNDRTILHSAARFGPKVLEYLLRQEGTAELIDVQDSGGKTPIHSAVGGDNRALLQRRQELKDNDRRESNYRCSHCSNEE